MTVIFTGRRFFWFYLNCNKNKFLAGNNPVIKSSLFFLLRWKARGRDGGERRRGENRLLCTLPCARSHANASKLDVTFVDQCFTQCLLARREERREKRKTRTERRKEQERKRESEKEKEENWEKERKRGKREIKHPHTTQHHHATHQTTHNTQLITQHNTLMHPHNTQHTTAPRTTDHDLESFMWTLGYALVRQPTVILRRKKWMLGYVHLQHPTMILPMPFFK